MKRALGGLVGSSREDCNEASTFRLFGGRLLDGTAPVSYGGENFKELRGQVGSLPSGAITSRFTEESGFLRFRNASLPNGEAGFCQTPRDGRVYLTFTSSPQDCVAIRLSVIEGMLSVVPNSLCGMLMSCSSRMRGCSSFVSAYSISYTGRDYISCLHVES